MDADTPVSAPTFPIRLVVGRLTLNQVTVVRPHHREPIPTSSNGRTAALEAAYRGSNPRVGTRR